MNWAGGGTKPPKAFLTTWPGGLRLAGARVAKYACWRGGGSFGDETTNEYRVEAPGLAPFRVEVSGRDSGSAGEMAYWGIDLAPGAPVMGYAALVTKSRKDAAQDPAASSVTWSTDCPA